jgi:hypothetical protein
VNQERAKQICMVNLMKCANCAIATLDKKMFNCTMYNNQTTLILTTPQTNVLLMSKFELKMCLPDYYPDYVQQQCIMKKKYGSLCSSSEECLNRTDFASTCLNGKCNCTSPTM